MADKVTWVLELLDRVSPGASKAAKSLEDVGKKADKAAASAEKGKKSNRDWGVGAKAVAVGMLAAGAAMKAVDLSVQAGKMALGAGAFAEQSKFALGILLKSGDEGKRVYDQILRMAQFFGQDPKEALQSFQTLLSKGFSTEDAIKSMQVLGDLKLTAPDANMESLIRAFGQIKSKPKLALEELKTQLGDAGLDLGLAYDEIGKLIGKKATDVEKAISAGQVDSNVGLLGIMNAIMRSSGSSAAGEQMAKFAKTTTGLAATLKSLPEQYLLRLNVDGGPLNKLLDKLVETLDPASPTGQKIIGGLESIAKWLVDSLDDVSVQSIIEGFETLADAIKAVWTVASAIGRGLWAGFKPFLDSFVFFTKKASDTDSVQRFADDLGKIAKVVGWLAGGLLWLTGLLAGAFVKVVEWVTEAIEAAFDPEQWKRVWDNFTGWLDDVVESMKTFGENIVQGIIDGILGKSELLGTTVKGLADSIPEITKSALQIKSPSKVMAQLGEYTVDGFLVGLNDNASSVADSMQTIVQAPAPQAASGGVRSVTVSAPVTVVIDGSNDPAAVVAEFERSMGEVFGRVALQLGAAA